MEGGEEDYWRWFDGRGGIIGGCWVEDYLRWLVGGGRRGLLEAAGCGEVG